MYGVELGISLCVGVFYLQEDHIVFWCGARHTDIFESLLINGSFAEVPAAASLHDVTMNQHEIAVRPV